MKSLSHIFCIVFLIIGLGFPSHLMAQRNNDYQIAEQYFKQGEFDKAADYYLKSYKRNRSSAYFDKYILSLVQNKDYKSAEKALKKEIKKRPDRLALRVTLGDVYLQSKDLESANEAWDQVIKRLNKAPNEIVPVAYLFTKLDQPTYALKAYELGKIHVSGFYSYYPQMADLYGLVGDYGKMIDTYLELIQINSGYLQTVQNLLNRNFDFTEDNSHTQLLKQKLLQKTNKNPENPIYPEMLIWFNLQQSNFEAAFVQVKSLDKRFKENGSRLLNFARLAATNENYIIAQKAYQAVINKGDFQPYYENALLEILHTQKTILNTDPNSSLKSYESLKNDYLKTINQFGIASFTAPPIREMAQIYTQNLNQSIEAKIWLQKVIDSPGMDKREIALAKIDMGDYLLMENQIWQAVLYYMQAEIAFKYDELGDEAKLKAAKVYYYTGDFNWAASKLNVLKGSTSKLISNDALFLSNLITDNITIDTTLHPMQLYAQADLLFVQQKYSEAFQVLDTLQDYYPGHMLMDEVLLQKYRILYAQQKYTEAAVPLQAIIDGYSFDILGDDALFLLAQLYENQLNNSSKAMEYYLIIITDHQDSVFISEARKRYRKLRGDSV